MKRTYSKGLKMKACELGSEAFVGKDVIAGRYGASKITQRKRTLGMGE